MLLRVGSKLLLLRYTHSWVPVLIPHVVHVAHTRVGSRLVRHESLLLVLLSLKVKTIVVVSHGVRLEIKIIAAHIVCSEVILAHTWTSHALIV